MSGNIILSYLNHETKNSTLQSVPVRATFLQFPKKPIKTSLFPRDKTYKCHQKFPPKIFRLDFDIKKSQYMKIRTILLGSTQVDDFTEISIFVRSFINKKISFFWKIIEGRENFFFFRLHVKQTFM